MNFRPLGGMRSNFKYAGASSPSKKVTGYGQRIYRRKAQTMNRFRGYPYNMRSGGFLGRYPTGLGTSPEQKNLDTDISETSISNTGSIVGTINAIPQGAASRERVGRKVTLKQIGFRGSIQVRENEAMNQRGDNVVRIIFYLDKQANKAAVSNVTDLLQTDNIYSFNKLENKGRFRILGDLKINTKVDDESAADSGRAGTSWVEWYKNVNIPIEFIGGTGSVGEITSNNIGMIIIGLHSSVYCRTDVYGTCRIRYYDA